MWARPRCGRESTNSLLLMLIDFQTSAALLVHAPARTHTHTNPTSTFISVCYMIVQGLRVHDICTCT